MIDRIDLFNLLQHFTNELSAYHDHLSSALPEKPGSISGFIRRSIALWKSNLKNGEAFTSCCDISSVVESAQSAGSVLDEILADGCSSQHWLPVSNGCCNSNTQTVVETNSQCLTIVCEVRDGYASIFVSPEGQITWESRKVDRETTFKLSYVRDILEILGGQLDLSTDFMRKYVYFYSNCPEIFKNVSNHANLPLAVPYYISQQEAVYVDLSWDTLDVFLPFRDGFLRRRLPSLGLKHWLKNRFVNNNRLQLLKDETIKSVLLRGRYRFEESSNLELDPDDLSEPLAAYSDHIFHMLRECRPIIHLCGWFGSPLIQKHIPTVQGSILEFPPEGCLSTWHDVLCIQ